MVYHTSKRIIWHKTVIVTNGRRNCLRDFKYQSCLRDLSTFCVMDYIYICFFVGWGVIFWTEFICRYKVFSFITIKLGKILRYNGLKKIALIGLQRGFLFGPCLQIPISKLDLAVLFWYMVYYLLAGDARALINTVYKIGYCNWIPTQPRPEVSVLKKFYCYCLYYYLNW